MKCRWCEQQIIENADGDFVDDFGIYPEYCSDLTGELTKHQPYGSPVALLQLGHWEKMQFDLLIERFDSRGIA